MAPKMFQVVVSTRDGESEYLSYTYVYAENEKEAKRVFIAMDFDENYFYPIGDYGVPLTRTKMSNGKRFMCRGDYRVWTIESVSECNSLKVYGENKVLDLDLRDIIPDLLIMAGADA